jgi:hypothetical protein
MVLNPRFATALKIVQDLLSVIVCFWAVRRQERDEGFALTAVCCLVAWIRGPIVRKVLGSFHVLLVFENSEVADLSPWGGEFATSSRSCSAVIAAVVSSTLRTRRERELDLFLSFCILRNDWKKSFESFDLIQEELDKGLLIATVFSQVRKRD